MTPVLLDHAIAVLLCVVFPFLSARSVEDVEAMRDPAVRRRMYWTTLLSEWGYGALILGTWIWMGRAWTPLGLGLDLGWGFWAVGAFGVVLLVSLHRQLQRVRNSPRLQARMIEEVGELAGVVPTNPGERRLFRTLAVTAGVCEELAYRGFLIWYLGAWFDPWAAVLMAGVAFGGGHLYQGPRQAGRIALLGIVTGALYWLAGSLWLPMLLHTLVDVNQVETARVALAAAGDGDPDDLPAELPLEPGT